MDCEQCRFVSGDKETKDQRSILRKADARTPERYDRARTMRSLDTARKIDGL